MRKERENIFKLFLHSNALKFVEIEKSLKLRSNHLSYYLSAMAKEGLLYNKNKRYRLTKKGEQQLPIFTNISSKIFGPVPVVLVNAMHKDKVLLIKRDKRPYKNYFSLVGGKLRHEETIKDCALRLLKEKTDTDGIFKGISSVMHERVIDDGVKHSFILLLANVDIEDNNKLISINKIDKNRIVPSDYWLIKNKSRITTSETTDKKGKLRNFRIISC